MLVVSATITARAAEEPEAPKSSARDILRARIAEDAKKKNRPVPPKPSPPPAPADTSATPAAPATAVVPQSTPPAASEPGPKSEPASKATTTKDSATLLPKVEVKKERITILDVEIAKQEESIARERKNLKTTEADLALNDLKIAKPLAIFGGESAQFRQRVAAERVELMEAEKDILEAMKRARTREEKAVLQKQLDELRIARRELDKTLR